MKDIEIISFGSVKANKENNNNLITPLETLADAYQDIKAGKIRADKLIIIVVDTEDDGMSYDTSFYASKLKTSEAIALLEIVKQTFLNMITGKRNA